MGTIKYMTEYEWYTEYEHLTFNTNRKTVLVFTRENHIDSLELIRALKELAYELNDVYIYQIDENESASINRDFSIGYTKSVPVVFLFDGTSDKPEALDKKYVSIDYIIKSIVELERKII